MRREAVRKPAQSLGDVSKRTNPDGDHDTTSARLRAIVELQCKLIVVAFNRANLHLLESLRRTLLKSQTVIAENIESNRLCFAVRDRPLLRKASERVETWRGGQIRGERIRFQQHPVRHVTAPTVHWPTKYACLNSGSGQMRRKGKPIWTRANNGDFHR